MNGIIVNDGWALIFGQIAKVAPAELSFDIIPYTAGPVFSTQMHMADFTLAAAAGLSSGVVKTPPGPAGRNGLGQAVLDLIGMNFAATGVGLPETELGVIVWETTTGLLIGAAAFDVPIPWAATTSALHVDLQLRQDGVLLMDSIFTV
jgi:hypothetical protein